MSDLLQDVNTGELVPPLQNSSMQETNLPNIQSSDPASQPDVNQADNRPVENIKAEYENKLSKAQEEANFYKDLFHQTKENINMYQNQGGQAQTQPQPQEPEMPQISESQLREWETSGDPGLEKSAAQIRGQLARLQEERLVTRLTERIAPIIKTQTEAQKYDEMVKRDFPEIDFSNTQTPQYQAMLNEYAALRNKGYRGADIVHISATLAKSKNPQFFSKSSAVALNNRGKLINQQHREATNRTQPYPQQDNDEYQLKNYDYKLAEIFKTDPNQIKKDLQQLYKDNPHLKGK